MKVSFISHLAQQLQGLIIFPEIGDRIKHQLINRNKIIWYHRVAVAAAIQSM